MAVPRKLCGGCNGRGVVPRERRKMGDGSIDPLDFQRERLCDPCGGAGSVPDVPGSVAAVERQPGFVADQIGVAAFWQE